MAKAETVESFSILLDLSVVAPDQRLYRRNDFPDDMQL